MFLTEDLLQVLSRIASQTDGNQSLESLAARSRWSKFHLHRKFSQELGETPKRYTSRLRLNRAAASLAASREPVLAIALENGFHSHEVFTRAFHRQFGCTPRKYRQNARAGFTQQELGRHREMVNTVGPCVGLYKASTTYFKRSNSMPLESIVRKELEAQPILYIQRRLPRSQLQSTMAECFGMLFGHGMKVGLAIAGQPIARYVSTGPGLWTVDFVLPLAMPAESENEMQAGFLYEGSVAFAVHKGAYEELPDSNAEVEKWIEENGLKTSGSPWESYVTSPAEVPDTAEWITELFWPISD